MGYSDPGPVPRTSRQIAEEMAALIRNSGLPTPVVLVGLSFGGYNTRIVASKYPDLVSGLVLVSASHERQGERYEAAGIPSGRPPDILLTLGPIAARLGLLRLAGITLGAPPSQAAPPIRSFVEATAFRTSRYYAMASELKNTRESGDEVSAMRRTLTIPLAVVSPGKDRERTAEINAELQADMVTLSTRSCHVVAEESVHGIGEQPEIVVKAIHDVVSASTVANGKPGC
jgi:pimeloyl-ACP methyl ester carboxylesterase